MWSANDQDRVYQPGLGRCGREWACSCTRWPASSECESRGRSADCARNRLIAASSNSYGAKASAGMPSNARAASVQRCGDVDRVPRQAAPDQGGDLGAEVKEDLNGRPRTLRVRLWDSEPLVGAPECRRRTYEKCAGDRRQGITVGRADHYDSTLPGQTLDLPPGLGDGSFCLRLTVDPFDLLRGDGRGRQHIRDRGPDQWRQVERDRSLSY